MFCFSILGLPIGNLSSHELRYTKKTGHVGLDYNFSVQVLYFPALAAFLNTIWVSILGQPLLVLELCEMQEVSLWYPRFLSPFVFGLPKLGCNKLCFPNKSELEIYMYQK